MAAESTNIQHYYTTDSMNWIQYCANIVNNKYHVMKSAGGGEETFIIYILHDKFSYYLLVFSL